jgi:hypothetical protein
MRQVLTIPDGTRGFDANATVGATAATVLFGKGYRFAARYVRRRESHASDLSLTEIATLHNAGIAVSIVQHVERDSPPWWTPWAEKGTEYGVTAARACGELTIPRGVTVWLDLEGITPGTDAGQVDAYCRAWFEPVSLAGYLPGLYVGWGAVLSPGALYRLPFTRYWRALNLNDDQVPATRGCCMRQHEQKPGDVPPGIGFPIDTDTVQTDLLGGLPTMFAPDEWDGALR